MTNHTRGPLRRSMPLISLASSRSAFSSERLETLLQPSMVDRAVRLSTVNSDAGDPSVSVNRRKGIKPAEGKGKPTNSTDVQQTIGPGMRNNGGVK
jgi:hypothetical protein